MPSRLLIALLAFFLICTPVLSQKQVTINRAKLAQDRNRKEKARKHAVEQKRQVASMTGSKTQKRHVEQPKAASYLRVNGQYADVINKEVGHAYRFETFTINTDGSSWDILNLPLFCRIQNRTATSLTLQFNENSTYDARKDWFLVKSDNKSVKVNITQKGKPVKVVASITGAEIIHNVLTNGEEGMLINGQLSVKEGSDLPLYAVVRIEDEFNRPVSATSKTYRLSDNDASFITYVATDSQYNSSQRFQIIIPNNSFYPGYKKKNELTLKFYLFCGKSNEYVSGVTYSVPFIAKKKKKGTKTERMKF